MDKSNKIVHGLWIGKELPPIALLCIKSFLAHGHEFHLWTYNNIITKLPSKVVIEDANQIIPKAKVFYYKKGDNKGSYAGFSDIFRAKLLYEKGEWYVDMDIICLKPLDFKEEYVFREHDKYPCVGNIMKCPKGSEVMLYYYKQVLRLVDKNNTVWEKPIKILGEIIVNFGLRKYIKKNICNPDNFRIEVLPLLKRQRIIPHNWYVLHWCTSCFDIFNINQYRIKKDSTLGRLLNQYKIYSNIHIRTKIMALIKEITTEILRIDETLRKILPPLLKTYLPSCLYKLLKKFLRKNKS